MVSIYDLSLALWCLLGVRSGESVAHTNPKLSEQFSLHQELIDSTGKTIAASTEVFDYTGKLARADMVPPINSDLAIRYGIRPLTIVSDFNTGHRYVIDRWARNCTKMLLPQHSWVSQLNNTTYVKMKHSYHVFDHINGNSNYSFIRNTTVREVPVWQYSKKNDTVEEDLYLLDHSWTYTPEERGKPQQFDTPVALRVKTFATVSGTRKLVSQQMYHIYDFYTGHLDGNAFNIGDCFSIWGQYKSLMFLVKGSYLANVYGKHEQVYTAMRNAIATHAQISPLRVTDVYISQSLPLFLDVLFTLRIAAKQVNVEAEHPSEVSLEQAMTNLNMSIIQGFSITVPYQDGTQKLEVLTSTLNKRSKYYFKYDSPTVHKTYSPGQMAGLAIGMILMGFVFGIGAAYFIHKRLNTEVPYQVSA